MKIIHSLCLQMKMTNLTKEYRNNDIGSIKDEANHKKNVYFLYAYHIISHTEPTPLIQHLLGTRFMQQSVQATPAFSSIKSIRLLGVKYHITIDNFALSGEGKGD